MAFDVCNENAGHKGRIVTATELITRRKMELLLNYCQANLFVKFDVSVTVHH